MRAHSVEPALRDAEPQLRGSARAGSRREASGASTGATTAEDVDGEASAAEAPSPSLRLDTVDGLTGRAVGARWNLGWGKVTAGPFPPGAVIDDDALARVRRGVADSIALWESEFLDAGEVRADAWPPDAHDASTRIVVRPVPGYVLEDLTPSIRARIAAGVAETYFILPLWPEAILDLSVLDPEGRPAEGAALDGLVVAGRRRDDLVVESEGLPAGQLRIRGIPGLPGEPIRAVIAWGWDPRTDGEASVEMVEGENLEDPQLVTRIPQDPRRPWHEVVRLLRPRGPGSSVVMDNDLLFEESLGRWDAPESGARPATLRVRALGWDGTPLADTIVNDETNLIDETTDARGYVRFSGLRPGNHWITMRAPGRFAARRRVTLEEGQTAELDIQEPIGATLEVLVTDEDGRPRPFARLDVGDLAVLDVVDGVQRLDLFTDALGRRTLRRVEPGRTRVTARWGSRRGRRRVKLRDAETTSIRIVAK